MFGLFHRSRLEQGPVQPPPDSANIDVLEDRMAPAVFALASGADGVAAACAAIIQSNANGEDDVINLRQGSISGPHWPLRERSPAGRPRPDRSQPHRHHQGAGVITIIDGGLDRVFRVGGGTAIFRNLTIRNNAQDEGTAGIPQCPNARRRPAQPGTATLDHVVVEGSTAAGASATGFGAGRLERHSETTWAAACTAAALSLSQSTLEQHRGRRQGSNSGIGTVFVRWHGSAGGAVGGGGIWSSGS
jgi:hypothetical protein